MGLFTGKKGIIMGLVNDRSLAWAVTKRLAEEGAELGFSYLPDTEGRNRMATRLRRLTAPLQAKLVLPCDVGQDSDITRFFAEVRATFGTIDFLVHSIAYAPPEDLRGLTHHASREGFKTAMDISVYSLLAVTRCAETLMPGGGSIVTMTYFGGEKVCAGYNLMGICKAALDAATRYLAFELGSKQIRVNAISAGPMPTLAASGVGDFDRMVRLYSAISPLGRNVTQLEVGNAAVYLLSDMSTATTGEILHVDCGYNVMGNPGRAADRVKIMD